MLEVGSVPAIVSIWNDGADLDELSGEGEEQTGDILASLNEGVEKNLVIFWKPFGGNTLHFYDERLCPILDVISLYSAKKIIFTNQQRIPGQSLRGRKLVECSAMIRGRPSLFNRLDIEYNNGNTYSFYDEYSFAAWSIRDPRLYAATAYIQ